MKSYIGETYNSNNFGQFTIIDEIDDYNSKERIFQIKFLNTGYITNASLPAITHGCVKDYLVPVVAGVGYLGYVQGPITKEPYYRYYKAWNDMINRCYNIEDKDYPLYGGIGITVDPSWHCFETFFEDIHYIPGYELKELYPSIYQLDKDYLQINIPKNQRIYSKYTCMWLSKHDNVMIMNRDNPNSSGYYGVYFKDNSYCTRINNTTYGRFTNPEAAAYLFNILYPIFNQNNIFANVQILNNVRDFTIQELKDCMINKNIFLPILDMVQRLSERSTT